jgi:hypothetical protein
MTAFYFLIAYFCATANFSVAKEIFTNQIISSNAPDWLTNTRVEKVTDHIQSKLEWSIHRIKLYWYTTQADFNRVHNYGPLVYAITKHENGDSTIHIGPRVTDKNFDEFFGHELVHVIVFQKYKDAIPKWFEEGLANYLSKAHRVDYTWLIQHPFPKDVHDLAHPFNGTADDVNYRYKASQALAEMLDKKCDLENLIRLSVQRKMEDRIKTYCEMKDLNAAFRDWVTKQAETARPQALNKPFASFGV